jgi:purine-binding chemotaxis protein CheW
METLAQKEIQNILEQRARELAGSAESEEQNMETLGLAVFSLGQEAFGVDISHIQEIQPLKRQMWSVVPCTPRFIEGAVNIRGRIYSMMNVAAYLEIDSRLDMENAHVLLVRGYTRPEGQLMEFCIVADDRPRLRTVSRNDIQPSTGSVSTRAQEYVQGVTSDMLMILDLEKLISDPGIVVTEEAA